MPKIQMMSSIDKARKNEIDQLLTQIRREQAAASKGQSVAIRILMTMLLRDSLVGCD